MLLHERLQLQADQLRQTHIQDRLGLPLGEHQIFRLLLAGLGFKLDSLGDAHGQAVLHLLLALAAPENLDDQVDHVHGLYQALLNLPPLQLPGQKILVLPGADLKLEIHMVLDDLL